MSSVDSTPPLFDEGGEPVVVPAASRTMDARVEFLVGALGYWTFGDSKLPGVKAQKKRARDALTNIARNAVARADALKEGG